MAMILLLTFVLALSAALCPAANPTFRVDAGHPAGKVSPMLYGLMTEEINHSYDGGLYAELIRNRAFLDSTNNPVNWTVVTNANADAAIALTLTNGFNDNLKAALQLTVTRASKAQPAGMANNGYWGIPVKPHTRYRATLLAKSERGFDGPVTISIVSDDQKTVFAGKQFSGLTEHWKKYEISLKTGALKPTSRAHFEITLDRPGAITFGLVSLFPAAWNNRPNGLRPDLMQMLVDLNPKFLRFPGGNYLEGNTVEERFDWKKTLGPIEDRPGHACPWGYRSSDGLGLLEFLEWCEDMKAEPLLAVYAGYSLKGMHVNPGPDLQPYVQEALEEIEYVTGATNTPWGARRARAGHPRPFPLHYVEIGNEDWFDKSGSYQERFAQFHDAIKARYPELKTISSIGNEQPENLRVHTRKPDVLDEHYYRSTDEFLRMSPDYARNYDRSGPEVFVGEWAAHEDAAIKPWSPAARQQPPTPTMKAAIGDAAFMAAMERNSDVIRMQCYAPLLVNVNRGARQWRPDLIGYDALSSYGSPSYYAFRMFSRTVGDELLAASSSDTTVQGCATLDSRTGKIIIKLVNPEATKQALQIDLDGVARVKPNASVITLTGDLEDMNSISKPRMVVPQKTTIHGVKPQFNYTLPAHSIVVLEIGTR